MPVPSVSLIPWNRRLISFSISLVHFFVRPLHQVPLLLGFSSIWEDEHINLPWLYCYFSCGIVGMLPVFSCLCTVYVGTDVGGGLRGGIVATWLAMILWTFIRLAMILYMCTSGTMHVLTS